jgi:hypothetical protein
MHAVGGALPRTSGTVLDLAPALAIEPLPSRATPAGWVWREARAPGAWLLGIGPHAAGYDDGRSVGGGLRHARQAHRGPGRGAGARAGGAIPGPSSATTCLRAADM